MRRSLWGRFAVWTAFLVVIAAVLYLSKTYPRETAAKYVREGIPASMADEVRITILHELAHHLGIDDEDRLAELGID
jgi:hypothetical protein